jgi:glycosyltransferase involved in cell wall biosynthesis
MKILHVITSLRTGGAEKLMVDLLPRMKVDGHEVDLCVFDGVQTSFYEEIERRGVKVIPLGHAVYSLCFIGKLIPLMRRYDIVHSHNTACQYFVAIASLFAECRIFTTEHNTSNRRRNVWWRMIDRWMYERYEKIVCISELTQQNLIRHIGKRFEKKCVIIYNGIDLSVFQTLPTPSHASCEKTILMVSAFREQKDQKTLIKAMKELPSDYVLELAGGGDERLIAECKQLAQEQHLSERARFLGVRTDVLLLLAKADVVVLSSHYEGLSLSSLEGMASGKPFVASDVEGLRDIVGGYGVLFPHGDAQTLAFEIQQLCEDKAYAKTVAEKCQERAKMFDVSVMTRNYLNLYQKKGIRG